MKDEPTSERMSRLEQALRPYGKHGQEIFMNRMKIEMQQAQEKEQKKQEKIAGKQSSIIGRMLNGGEVSDEEKGELNPQQLLAIEKLRNKAPVGGASAQPVPQQYTQLIPQILNANKEANADELTEAFDVAGVPTQWSNRYTENRRRQDEAKASNQPGQEYAKGREKTVEGYVTSALRGSEEAENMTTAMDTIESAIRGDITEPGIMATIKHDPYGQLFFGLTPDEATLTAANKYMLEGTKGIWGSKPTEKEMFTLLNGMLPSIGKTKEANLAGLQVIKRSNEIKKIHSQIVDELTDGGNRYVPNIESLTSKAMKPLVEQFKKDAYELKDNLNSSEKIQTSKAKEGKIKVRAPDGKTGFMTQQQIEAAKEKNVIFTPVQ